MNMAEEKKIIVFDLDGTLANIEHRLHFIQGEKKDWDAFYAACINDKPIWPVIDANWALVAANQIFRGEIVILTGRSRAVEHETQEWLEYFSIDYDELVMRSPKDYRPDHEFKRQWAEPYKHRIHSVYEDRSRVVQMWRELGVTCFQVANGDY